MTKNIFRKGLVIGIIILFVGASVLPSISGDIIDDNKTSRETYDDYSNLIQQITTEGCILGDWPEQDKLLALDGGASNVFGWSVSISGDYALIAAPWDDDNGISSGSAYIFKRTVAGWIEERKLLASDGKYWDFFGESVSISGDYALIGAPCDDDNGVDSGSAYIFRRNGNIWTEEAKLTASDGETEDEFGESVSISGDYALIAAPWDDGNGDEYSGSAYIFRRNGNIWTEEAKLTASDGEYCDGFGSDSVSIDGDYAIIGAPYDDDVNGVDAGSAYVFKRDGSIWTEEAKLTASDGETEDEFGYSVSIEGDYALIGAAWDDDDVNGVDAGSAYVFKRDGSIWTEEAKLTASDGETEDHFGWSVSIDGDYALIGVQRDDDNGYNSGSAYVFKRDGSIWTEEAKLTASDGEGWDVFGYSVSIEGDYALVGAPGDDDNGDNSGSAYVFMKSGGNQPPNTPSIDGPTSGKPETEYEYKFNAVDPDGDDVKYYIDWGDGNKEWTDYYGSGEEVKINHTWSEKGKYTIKARAKDTNDLLGPWGTLIVTIPRNKLLTNTLFLRLLERFPNAFPILRHMLGLQ